MKQIGATKCGTIYQNYQKIIPLPLEKSQKGKI